MADETLLGAPAAETLGKEPAAPTPTPEDQKTDPIDGAAGKLYPDGKQPEGKTEETAEEKAAREAKEASETPEEKAAREAKEAKEKDERYGAPEGDAAYEPFKMPEGYEIDEAGNNDLTEIAKDLNLSQASAQKLVDKVVALRQRDAEKLEAVHTSWVDQSKADKEFGGDKLNESLSLAQKALKEFGTPELGELLTGARLGNHPEIIRLLSRVGKSVSDAPIINGGKPVQSDPAKTLYPNLK